MRSNSHATAPTRRKKKSSGHAIPGRNRVGGICIADGYILMIERNRPSFGKYYVIPGGGMDPGEDPASTVKRELREETGLKVKAVREVFYEYTPTGGRHSYWIVNSKKLPVALPLRAEENSPARIKIRGTVTPCWIPLTTLSELRLLPPSIKTALIVAFRQGFPKRSQKLDEPWSTQRKRVYI